MASKLDAALAWASRGFRVFPLQAGGKLPVEQGWTTSASSDSDVVRAFWTDPVTGSERDNNVGVLTTDLVVFDVDTKAGKPGLDTFFRLGLEFDTLTVRTPTGGYHLYFSGIGREVGQSPLGPGIDVRSHNGYVVAPGSTIDGVAYEVELDLPVGEVPHAVRPMLRAPRARRGADGVSVELDQPEALEIAAHWLRREAPAAVQGQNGDDATYRVACRVRDFGLSEVVTLDVMLDEWNARCEPPWSVHELRLKVENAYRYATGAAGSASPSAVFGDVVDVPPPGRVACDTISVPEGVVRFGNMLKEEDITPRPWVIEGLLMERHVTLLAAPGGAGKSLMSLVLAAHLAVGQPLWGYVIEKPGKSIVYNAEDDLMEVSRRLIAICRAYGLDEDVVSSRVALLGSDAIDLQLTKGSNPPQIRQDHVDMLAHAAADSEVVLLAIDPMIEVHTGNESDSVEMRYVMSIFRTIARFGDVPVVVVQHTPKSSGTTTKAGDQDAARGSGAIANASRVMLTMYPATEVEALEIGARREDRKSYVRVDGAKVSYGAGRTGPLWLRWTSREIASGDSVGVLVEHDAKESRLTEMVRVATMMREALMAGGCAALSLADAAVALTRMDSTPGMELSQDEAKKKLQRLMSTPVRLSPTLALVLRSNIEGARGPHIVID